MEWRFLIHGGAGVISKNVDRGLHEKALLEIIKKVKSFAGRPESSAVDIVEYAVSLLEDDPLFNAGRGSVFSCEGTNELEASIMDGTTLNSGSTSLVTNIKNPIKLARIVMDKTNHSYIAGSENTKALAEKYYLEIVDSSYYFTEKRHQQLLEAKRKSNDSYRDHDLDDKANSNSSTNMNMNMNMNITSNTKDLNISNSLYESSSINIDTNDEDDGTGKGTVGCVCMKNGQIAAGTSTGGMTNKICGRIGDTPIIGSGTYANNNTAAVSCTGHGEIFIQYIAAYDVCAHISIGNLSLNDAMYKTVHNILPSNSGGMIGITSSGEYAMEMNCSGMFRGICDSNGYTGIGIWEELYTYQIE